MDGTKQIGERAAIADQWLVATLAELGGISQADAIRAANYYIKHKLVKRDWAMGRYQFKHGAFAEAAIIRRAVHA